MKTESEIKDEIKRQKIRLERNRKEYRRNRDTWYINKIDIESAIGALEWVLDERKVNEQTGEYVRCNDR